MESSQYFEHVLEILRSMAAKFSVGIRVSSNRSFDIDDEIPVGSAKCASVDAD